MEKHQLLAGNAGDKSICLCASGQFHVCFPNLEIRLCGTGLAKLSEILGSAQAYMRDEPLRQVRVTMGFVTLKIEPEELPDLAAMIDEALSKAVVLKSISCERNN